MPMPLSWKLRKVSATTANKWSLEMNPNRLCFQENHLWIPIPTEIGRVQLPWEAMIRGIRQAQEPLRHQLQKLVTKKPWYLPNLREMLLRWTQLSSLPLPTPSCLLRLSHLRPPQASWCPHLSRLHQEWRKSITWTSLSLLSNVISPNDISFFRQIEWLLSRFRKLFMFYLIDTVSFYMNGQMIGASKWLIAELTFEFFLSCMLSYMST